MSKFFAFRAATALSLALMLLSAAVVDARAEGCTSCQVQATYDCHLGLGRTKGFWHNQNGKAVLSTQDTAWRDRLNGLCLVKADGTPYDVPGGSFNTAHANFASWIVGPSQGGNMAHMLSTQLAAAVLNVEFGFASHLDNHWVDWNGGKENIQVLFTMANDSLCANPVTKGNHPARALQESLKNLFDGVNNNVIALCEKNEGPPPITEIQAFKYYDLNQNGQWDSGEVAIPGWSIEVRLKSDNSLVDSGVTDSTGMFSTFVDRDNTEYVVLELMDVPYVATTATSFEVVASQPLRVVEFGNVAIQCHWGLGKTRGFWMNSGANTPGKQALAAAFPDWVNALNALNLVDVNGNAAANFSAFDSQTAIADLLAWEGATPESNMAFKLSIQLATMVLNVVAGDMAAFPGIYLFWDGAHQNAWDVFAEADAMLAATLDANPLNDPTEGELELMKNYFDALNNNAISVYIVLPGPVAIGVPLPCLGTQPPEEQ